MSSYEEYLGRTEEEEEVVTIAQLLSSLCLLMN